MNSPLCFPLVRLLRSGLCFGMVGCLTYLNKVGIPGPWRFGGVARSCLEKALGSCAPDLCNSWVLDDHRCAEEVAAKMPDNPNVWSDGSCVTDDLAEVSVAGAVVFSEESCVAWNVRIWESSGSCPA